MTQQNIGKESAHDPEGSIFLFEPLTNDEFNKLNSGLHLDRGQYRGIDGLEKYNILQDLKLRQALTARVIKNPSAG